MSILIALLTALLKIVLVTPLKAMSVFLKSSVASLEKKEQSKKGTVDNSGSTDSPKAKGLAKKAQIRGLKLSIKAINMSIRILNLTLAGLQALMIFCDGIVLAIIFIVLVITISVSGIISSSTNLLDITQKNGHNKSTLSTILGNDFMGFGWDADFSRRLDEIETSYGASTRDWCEVLIITMNTAQQKGFYKTTSMYYIPLGIKPIETGGVNWCDSTSKHPLTSKTIARVGENSDGVWQITNAGWLSGRNDLYSGYNVTSPTSTWSDLRHYVPDAVYGLLSKMSTSSKSFNRSVIVKQAISDLGLSYSDKLYNSVLDCMFTTTTYASYYTNRTGISDRDYDKVCYADAVFTSQFISLYADSDFSLGTQAYDLSKSIISANTGYVAGRDFCGSSYSFSKAICGVTSNKDKWSDSYTKKGSEIGNCITKPDGTIYDGTLHAYLLSTMPESIRSKITSENAYDYYHDSYLSTGWSGWQRIHYSLTSALIANYNLNVGVDLLEVRSMINLDGLLTPDTLKSMDKSSRWLWLFNADKNSVRDRNVYTKGKTAGLMKQVTVKVWAYQGTTLDKVSTTTTLTVNAKLADYIVAIMTAIYNDPSRPVLVNYGAYNYRGIMANGKQTDVLSNHSLGMAIDFNAQEPSNAQGGTIVNYMQWSRMPESQSKGRTFYDGIKLYQANESSILPEDKDRLKMLKELALKGEIDDKEYWFYKPHPVVYYFRDVFGFYWGGDYTSAQKDGMHFEFTN